MVAQHVADSLMAGKNRENVIAEAAAWLKVHGKSRQARYLAQDIAWALAENGYIFVQFTTARPVDTAVKQQLEQYITQQTDAKTIECEFIVDTKLIGGVLIQTPYGTLDASVRARLAKIVEGVSR